MPTKTFGYAIKSLAFVGLTALAVSDAHAGFSAVNAAQGGELGHAAILSHAYGGSFAADGVNFTNGAVIATRLEDFSGGAGVMSLLSSSYTGNNSDQCWSDGVISARALARFAGYEQSLGVVDGDTGGSFHELFAVTGSELNVSGSVNGLDLCGTNYRFARGGGGDLFTSLDVDNLGGTDQMVSYRLTDPAGLTKYVLFFEDLGTGANSDWDYNDLVVEITARPSLIPLPPAAWSGLALLACGGLVQARRRMQSVR